MAAAESNEIKFVDILCCENTKCKKPMVISRREIELYEFRVIDLLYYVFSVSFFLTDIATDITVLVEYLLQGHIVWGYFAMGFTIVPTCVIQLFSLRWLQTDSSLKTTHWLLHFFCLGLLHRYLNLIYIAMYSLRNKPNSRRDKSWIYRQESDICILHLFESFMGAAPQLILQLYVIAILRHAPLWTSVSAIASFCSLVWTISIYVRATYNINQGHKSETWIALVLQAFWRISILTSRIAVLVLTAIFLRTWFLLFIGLHWLCMTIWVILQNTEFCPTMWEERVFNCIIGLIYCFDFFNLREGRSRHRVLTFYLIIGVQNLIFLTLYILYFKNTVKTNIMTLIATIIVGGMIIGLSSMLLYYTKFHPSRITNISCENEQVHSIASKFDTSKSYKLFYRNSLTSLHHSIDISQRAIPEEETATDKQYLLTNIVQISNCIEEGIGNRNCNTKNKSNTIIRTSTESETCAHKEEIASLNESSDNTLSESSILSLSLHNGLPDIDDTENQRQKRRGICLPIIHGSHIERNILSEDICIKSQKRRGIYEQDITSQLNLYTLDMKLSLENSEQGNFSVDIYNKMSTLDIIKNRGKLTTPTQLEASKIFDVDKISKDLQPADETMSCVTSIHDYENICSLGIARPPWCIRSWKGYTDIETYIHDDSVVRDRRRDTLTSTTGTTYSSEFSDGMYTGSFIRGILKQDEYMDMLVYDLVEPKKTLVYNNSMCTTSSDIDDRNTTFYMAKPVVIDDKDATFALDTIIEEHDDSQLLTMNEKFKCVENPCDSASTLVSTIDQITKYSVQNSPRHVYHTTRTQWENLNPNMTKTHFSKLLFDNDLKNISVSSQNDLTIGNHQSTAVAEKCDLDAIKEFVKCCAMESVKKTPLIDAILSDSPVLGSKERLVRQVAFVDSKDNFDVNKNDLDVEMNSLVPVENRENLFSKFSDLRASEIQNSMKKNHPSILKTSIEREFSDKENLAPMIASKMKRISNNDHSNDKRTLNTENDDKNNKSLICNMHSNIKEKRRVFLEQVL